MGDSRNYIIDRITSKKTSIEEFNFDALQAPPLSMFFSPFDIQELNAIAKSIRYSGKPEERYAAIDKVCKRLGLIKFGAGTNRVVYRHPEFPNIVFKIASDNIGLGDNPAEFRNQFILKPFVCKIFEVSPCGTVAVVERVHPITSREEFISVSDDVFTLITEWLIGEYVIGDIGAEYFMNFGIRFFPYRFGIVLIDYSYVYKLDGNKLFCRRKDPTSPTGTCDGVIDYDDAFSHLVCTKCGARYKAKELELKMKNREITTGLKEKTKMKVKISGGTVTGNTNNNTEEQQALSFDSTDKFAEPKTSFIRDTYSGSKVSESSNTVMVSFGNKKKDTEDNDKFVNGVKLGSAPVVTENKASEKLAEEAKPAIEAPVVEEPSYVEEVVKEKPVVEDAIVISEAIKEEAQQNAKPVESKGPAQLIDEAVAQIEEQLDKIDIDSLKEDCIYRLIDVVSKHVGASGKAFKLLISIANKIKNDINDDEFEDAITCSDLIDIITYMAKPAINVSNFVLNEEDGIDFDCAVDIYPKWLDDVTDAEALISYPEDTISLPGIKKYFADNTTETTEEEKEPQQFKREYLRYHAKVVSIKSLFPGSKNKNKILVFVDNNEHYLTIEDKIIAAEDIDDKSLNDISIVSTEWFNNLTEASSKLGASAPSAEEIAAAESSEE